MSKSLTPFSCDDISALAKSLRKQLQQHESFPSHVEMLNILAKASGLQNFQQLRQQHVEQLLSEQPELSVPIPKRLKPFMSSDYIMHSWQNTLFSSRVCGFSGVDFNINRATLNSKLMEF